MQWKATEIKMKELLSKINDGEQCLILIKIQNIITTRIIKRKKETVPVIPGVENLLKSHNDNA